MSEAKKSILIVDDSKVVLSVHSFVLKGAGYACETAENGFEALEKLMLKGYDLVLTDVNMPKMDGYELLHKLRALPSYASVPVIMISTEQESVDKNRGLEAGANLYIVKPTQPEALVANVKMLLASGG